MKQMKGELIDTIFIGDKSLSELASLFACDIQNDDDFYFRLAQNISQTDPEYLPMHLHEYSGLRLRGAVFGIGMSPKKDEKQRELLLSLLSHADPLIVAESIDALRRSGVGSLWPRIEIFLRHKSPYAIGAALRYARFALSHDEAFVILAKALSDSNSVVRQNALDELGDLGDKRALALIKPYCNDPDPDVKRAANTAHETIIEVSKESKQSG